MMRWSAEQLDSFTTLLEQRRKLREIAQLVLSLSDFFRAAWKVIEPETKLCWSWHYEYIAEFLELISSGQFKKVYPDKLGIILADHGRLASLDLAAAPDDEISMRKLCREARRRPLDQAPELDYFALVPGTVQFTV